MRTLFHTLGVAAAVGLFTLTIARANLRQVSALATHVGPWILIAFAPFMVEMLLETLGWSRLFRLVEETPRFTPLLRIRVASEAILLVVPGGALWADAMKVVLARSRLGIASSKTAATVAAAKPLATVGLALYLLVGVGVSAAVHRGRPELLGSRALAYVIGLAAILLGASAVAMRWLLTGALAERLRRMLARIPVGRFQRWIEERRMAFANADSEALRIARTSPRRLLGAGLPLFLGLVLPSAETAIILRLLGVHVPFEELMCLDAAISVMRSVAFVLPAGLGLTDLTYIAALSALGVPDHVSVGTALVIFKRMREVVAIVVGGALLIQRPGSGASTNEVSASSGQRC